VPQRRHRVVILNFKSGQLKRRGPAGERLAGEQNSHRQRNHDGQKIVGSHGRAFADRMENTASESSFRGAADFMWSMYAQ
jgi:hypothetical protein